MAVCEQLNTDSQENKVDMACAHKTTENCSLVAVYLQAVRMWVSLGDLLTTVCKFGRFTHNKWKVFTTISYRSYFCGVLRRRFVISFTYVVKTKYHCF